VRLRSGPKTPTTRPSLEAGNRQAVEAAFARAAHVVRHRTVINRITANSMEPRGCLAQYDSDDERYTIRCTIQSTFNTRTALADQIFQVPHSRARVICDNMGGGFGMKGGCYPEYALSLWVAESRDARSTFDHRTRGRAAQRRQSRGSIIDSELALDADLKFLGLRAKWLASIGAYYSTDRPTIPLTVALGCLVNTYAIPAIHVEVTAALTNTMAIAPYRGGGRPEPIYVTESTTEAAARQVSVSATTNATGSPTKRTSPCARIGCGHRWATARHRHNGLCPSASVGLPPAVLPHRLLERSLRTPGMAFTDQSPLRDEETPSRRG
jgi:carbon-monoxide dehydrogenase large subunit